jgi:hypothetical protein
VKLLVGVDLVMDLRGSTHCAGQLQNAWAIDIDKFPFYLIYLLFCVDCSINASVLYYIRFVWIGQARLRRYTLTYLYFASVSCLQLGHKPTFLYFLLLLHFSPIFFRTILLRIEIIHQ